MFGKIAFVLSLLMLALTIYVFVKHVDHVKSTRSTVSEIKSKIGGLIRDINHINRMEYEVDMEQQHVINRLAATK